MNRFTLYSCDDSAQQALLLEEKITECQQLNSSVNFAVERTFCCHWHFDNSQLQLVFIYFISIADGKLVLESAMTDKRDLAVEYFTQTKQSFTQANLVDVLGCQFFRLNEAVKLGTVAIAKPWGQEIWFTGIEERGVSTVEQNQHSLELPYFLAMAEHLLLGKSLPKLTLLKILDPLPEPVYGDLYFELHEEKQEVYVVTYVDNHAWEDGVGAIRYGFRQSKLAQYSDVDAFKAAYRQAVKNYEMVRRQIDSQLDECRLLDNIALTTPVKPTQIEHWLSHLPAELVAEEQTLRAEMNSFTELKQLRVGDVVRVPCLVPHSLQHGVRTIEFQTPVYERQILSFCQKVLTQAHWDTESAVDKALLTPPSDATFDLIQQDELATVERIVDFDDFEVYRCKVSTQQQYSVPQQQGYQLVIVINGPICIGNVLTLHNEEAAFIGEMVPDKTIVNTSLDVAVFLVAMPKAPS